MTENWTREILQHSIEMYRNQSCLWQIRSKDYTNKNLKNRGYDELVNYCKNYFQNADRNFVTKKIQNIRAAFRKEANKVKDSKRSGASSQDVYVPTLWYYDLLLFTIDQDTPLDSISNIASPPADSNESEQENVGAVEYSEVVRENEDLELPENRPDIFKTPTTSSAGVRSRKRNSNGDVSAELKKFMNVCSAAVTAKQEVDEFTAVTINIAAKLKKMVPEQAYLAESLINQVITKGLFNELTRSTTITEALTTTIHPDQLGSTSNGNNSTDLSDFYTNATKLYNL